MSHTKTWSLANACQRLAEEVGRIGREAAGSEAETIQLVEQHLRIATAALQGTGGEPSVVGATHLTDLARNVLSLALEPGDFDPARIRPGPQHQLVFRAVTGFVPTPDLITFLSSARQSGLLEVVAEQECFVLELEHGDIVHAYSDGAPAGERLGDILVAQGALTGEALDKCLGQAGRVRLGLRLWEQNLVTHDQLLVALEQQIRLLFIRLFAARAQHFSFWTGPPVEAQRKMRLNATGLILDGARVADERAARTTDESPSAAIGPGSGPATDPH